MIDLDDVVWNVRQELEAAGEAHSCIVAAATLLDTLEALGLSGARPLTVRPIVFNPRFAERLNREHLPTTEEQWAEWSDDGCARVAVGHGLGRTDQWNGHLVVVIPQALGGKDAVCDLTITQANVPDWNINLVPLIFSASAAFLSGEREFKASVNGCLVVYKAFPDDLSFQETPAWTEGAKRVSVVHQILHRLSSVIPPAVSTNSSAESYRNVGRNDPCPCGSGKKYKRCHLKA